MPGGEVGAAGITVIGVTPSHRRRGILRQMMRWLLDQARERNEPVAILCATESAIYQRFGFGIGTLQSQFDIERTRTRFLRPAPPLGRIRLVDLDEARELLPADLRRHPATDAGRGDPERGQVAGRALGAEWSAAATDEVPRGPRGRWRSPRLRDLPGQGRMG